MFLTILRRLVSICLISITLFFATSFNLNLTQSASAESITRDVTNLNTVDEISDAEYESDKMNRQQKQAMRSQQAEDAAEREKASESISEKLNLDEIVETVAGDRPATK